jgi:O-acetylhomoserine (thiol)-lyase
VGAFLLRARREGLRDFGACMSPHTAWLILQGIETLPLRMARHMSNTRKVVEFLAAQPFVGASATRCWRATPAMRWRKSCCRAARLGVQLRPQGQSREQGKKFIETLKIFSHLANVGDCRSLVIHPASTTHFRMTTRRWRAPASAQGTIRLSIGLEDPDDLIDDLKRALKAAEKAGA